jgi:hypothetical protein
MTNDDFGKLLPEVELVAHSSGLTVYCQKRLKTPRYIPFDQKGQCPTCRSGDLEADYMINQNGITISTNRMKQASFIPYDMSGEFAEDGGIVVKFRRKHITIPIKRRPFLGRRVQRRRRAI